MYDAFLSLGNEKVLYIGRRNFATKVLHVRIGDGFGDAENFFAKDIVLVIGKSSATYRNLLIERL